MIQMRVGQQQAETGGSQNVCREAEETGAGVQNNAGPRHPDQNAGGRAAVAGKSRGAHRYGAAGAEDRNKGWIHFQICLY